MDDLYPYLIMITIFIVIVMRLINGRNIQYECALNKNISDVIFFLLIGLLLYIKLKGVRGSLCFGYCCMAGGVYHILPGGFSEKAIYVKAKAYPFDKISDMRLEEGEELRINFTYHHLTKVLICSKEHKTMIKQYIALYNKHN